jgi:hypothetical protein
MTAGRSYLSNASVLAQHTSLAVFTTELNAPSPIRIALQFLLRCIDSLHDMGQITQVCHVAPYI